jgi:hypothetical protein
MHLGQQHAPQKLLQKRAETPLVNNMWLIQLGFAAALYLLLLLRLACVAASMAGGIKGCCSGLLLWFVLQVHASSSQSSSLSRRRWLRVLLLLQSAAVSQQLCSLAAFHESNATAGLLARLAAPCQGRGSRRCTAQQATAVAAAACV